MEPIIEDDPVLGRCVAYYPNNRLRLLLIGASVLAVVWFVITVALWEADATTASAITVGVLAVTTLAVGWYASHLWNREVILYESGFSVRQGSQTALIPYDDVTVIRQRAERRAYFGGLVHYTVYRITLHTNNDEIIFINNLYRRLDDLMVRLDHYITATMRPAALDRLQAGESLIFGEGLSLTQIGLHGDGRDLPWNAYGGYRVAAGHLALLTAENDVWYRARLDSYNNLSLFIELLHQHQPVERTDAGV